MAATAIDIIIPVYNCADTLDASLRSLADQSESDFRVICVDDGSTDATPRILAEWAANDARFHVITKANSGIVDALNIGLQSVEAPLVARLDGDDLCDPLRLERQRQYLDSNPDCVAVGCRVQHIDEHGVSIGGLPHPGPPELANADWVPAHEPYIIHPFLMARTAALKAVGGYRNVPNSEDSDLFWRLSERGRLHNLPETLGQYRMHLNSVSGSSILNGRVMAVGSQLGALSYRRRRAGSVDLAFEKSLMADLKRATTFEKMFEVVSSRVPEGEREWLKLCMATKLLELARYRPYELEDSDCRFVKLALRRKEMATAENLKQIMWLVAETGKRLLLSGRRREMLSLLPMGLLPHVLTKALLRR